MAMDVGKLVKLLQELTHEVSVCLSFESKPGVPSPIMAGDFAAEAYNDVLRLAKESCVDPVIQALPEIEKLGKYERPLERESDWGTDPRMHKMREVSFSARRLLTLLEGVAENQAQGSQGAVALIVLLEALGKEIERLRNRTEPVERYNDRVQSLVDTYNTYLDVALQEIEDPVFRGLFQRLTTEESGRIPGTLLSELDMAQSALLRYLNRTHKRAAKE